MSEIWNKSKNFWSDTDRSEVRYKTGLDHLTQTMIHNARKVGQEVDGAIETIRGIEQRQGNMSENLVKALNNQTILMSKLQASVDSLNGTLNAALGQSLDAMHTAHETAQKIATAFEQSSTRMNEFAGQFKQGMDTFNAAGKTRRRLRRDKDGSWLVDSD